MINVFEKAAEGIKTGVKNGAEWINNNKANLIKGALVIGGTIAGVLLTGKLIDSALDSDGYIMLDEEDIEVWDAEDADDEADDIEVDVEVELIEED